MIESHKCWNRARWVSINLFQFVCLHTEVCISHTKAHTKIKKNQCTSLWRNSILNMISVLLFFHWVCFSPSLSLFSLLYRSLWINSDEYFPLFSYTKDSHGNGSWFLFKYLNNMGFLSLMIRFEFDDPLKNTGDSVKFFIRSMENSWYIFLFLLLLITMVNWMQNVNLFSLCIFHPKFTYANAVYT